MSEPSESPWPCDLDTYIAWISARYPMPPLTDEQIVRLRELFGPAIRASRGGTR